MDIDTNLRFGGKGWIRFFVRPKFNPLLRVGKSLYKR